MDNQSFFDEDFFEDVESLKETSKETYLIEGLVALGNKRKTHALRNTKWDESFYKDALVLVDEEDKVLPYNCMLNMRDFLDLSWMLVELPEGFIFDETRVNKFSNSELDNYIKERIDVK